MNGFDTGSIGAITSMEYFHSSIGKLTPTQLGFTVSLIMLTGAAPSVYAGTLAEKFGRLRLVLIGAVLFAIGAVIEASASSLIVFNIGRAIAGLAQGVYLSNMSVLVFCSYFNNR
jgi:MFS family permease